ncbi:MAG: IS66 family insertion sequence element accessory protein TnpA [Archangium sp.]
MLKTQQKQREKWVEVVEEYERSGLTQAEFVARRGVALSTLQSWLRRWRAQRSGPVRLLPVEVAPTSLPAKTAVEVSAPLEVVVPGGVRLCVAPGTDVGYVAKLVEALRAC